jgi:hypothetical protein
MSGLSTQNCVVHVRSRTTCSGEDTGFALIICAHHISCLLCSFMLSVFSANPLSRTYSPVCGLQHLYEQLRSRKSELGELLSPSDAFAVLPASSSVCPYSSLLQSGPRPQTLFASSNRVIAKHPV